MSIPINTDNSVQLSYSSFPFTVADIDNYATSNFVSNVSNVLRTAINTKQDTLTAATNLLGVGTSITAIDYTKVSVNKPTNFQADWNSTIINKPTIYTQSQIDTFLNAKQNNLTAATTLLGTGGSITGINYNTVINKPSYSLPLNSNATTNTISISLSDYYNQTQVNTAIGNTSNYALNISNILKTNIDTKQDKLTASTVLSGIGSNLTLVNYNTLSNLPDLTVYNGWTKSGNDIYNTSLANGRVGIGTSAPTGTLEITNNITDANTSKIKFGGKYASGINMEVNQVMCNAFFRFMTSYTATNDIAYFGYMDNYDAPSSSSRTMVLQITRTALNMTGDIYATGNVGFGIAASATYKLNVNGSINSTSLYQNGTLIDFNSYATNTNLTNNFYNKTEANNLLSAKQATLTFSSPLVNTTNTITFNESSITSLTNFYNKTEANNLLNAKQATLTFSSPLVNTANTINFNESSITSLTNFYNKTEANSLLNAKQATLTFSSPLVNTTNTITFNESAITTLTNFYNKTEANARYLQLTGGDLSGTLNISYANPILTIKATGESQTAILYLSTPLNPSSALKTAIISGGISSWSRSRLHFCLNSNDVSNDVSNNATIADARMSIDPNGSVGIGITTPSARLHIREATGTTHNINNGTIMIDHDNSGGASSITFRSKVNRGSDYGYIQYQDAATVLGAGEAAKLIIGTQNDGDDDILLLPSGGVGIGTSTPSGYKLYVNGNVSYTGYLTSGNNVWNRSADGIYRTYYETNSISYYCCGGNNAIGHIFMNNSYGNAFHIYNNGDVKCFGALTTNGTLTSTGTINANNGILFINAADATSGGSKGIIFRSGYDTPNNNNYNCSILTYDHDAQGFCDGLSINAFDGISFCTGGNTRVERMRINSSGNVGIGTQPTYKKLEINGDTNCTGAFGITGDLSLYRGSGGIYGNINAGGNITCLLYSITNSGTDYVGVGNATSGNNQNYLRQLYIMFETFTGFHRCFTNDELFDNENPQNFKDTYIGRIVVSTGKIATDFKSIDNDDWEIKYDKEGITIEDALPMIELSRKKKDKRVFGVLGNSKRNNSRSERLIINSVGEGGIWICNSNGNIENGDYITSSDYLGYGEKQDEIFLCNYTVAKATMDCDFQLDNPLYNCIEIQEGLRIAFIAATYHCG